MADRDPRDLRDLEAERAVLGACMLDGQALAVAAEMLPPAAFAHQPHRLIYEAMLDMDEAGVVVDATTLANELRARPWYGRKDGKTQLEQVGGLTYLTAIVNATPTAAHVEHYARIVRDLYRRRRLRDAAHRILASAEDLATDLEAVIDAAERLILEAAQEDGGDDAALLDEVVRERFERLFATRHEPPDTVLTGFAALDVLMGGLPRGGLCILAARPSMGKSLLAQQIATNVAKQGHVLFFSAEMGRTEIADRLLSQWTGIDLVRIRTKRLTPPEWETVRQVLGERRVGWCWIDDAASLTTREIRARSRRIAVHQPLDLIVVDYLQYLADPMERGESRNDQIGRMTRALKALARELNCVVLLLSQLSRAPERRANRRPELADLRDSGNIEQDADVVMLLHRPDYYDPEDRPGLAEVAVAKHRNGPTGMVELYFDRARGFRDLEKRRIAS